MSRPYLLREIEDLKKENEGLRAKLATLQVSKETAETHAEDRKREKEALRAKLASQKKSEEATRRTTEQLNEKITELRKEIERLSRTRK